MSNSIKSNIEAFKRKYYLNKLLRGSLISLLLFASMLLIISSLEGYFWFGQAVRMSFLGILTGTLLLALVWGVIIPLSGLFKLRKGISDEDTALEIGKFFPEVSDKLLNYLQLERLNAEDKSLLNAALIQKTNQLQVVPFQRAVNLRPNLRYAYAFLSIIVFFFLVSFISPGFISDSSSRILQFNKEFERPAPFSFQVGENLQAFKNESFELEVKLEGEYIPESVFLLDNNRRIRLNKKDVNSYSFVYPSISESKTFQLEAAGFKSQRHTISVFERPEILDFKINVDYPAYTGIEDKSIENTGSLIVPEGSKLTWNLNTLKADDVYFKIGENLDPFSEENTLEFQYQKVISQELLYEIQLKNQYASNKSRIAYEISVIKDQFPDLEVEFIPDTITYKSVIISGNAADDYGFRSLALWYRKNGNGEYQRLPLSLNNAQNNLQFFYQMDLDTLDIQKDRGIQLYVSIRDNDVINGYKETRSPAFYFRIPDKKELERLVQSAGNKTESKFNESEQISESLNDKLQDLEDRLKNKKELSWQDEKLLEDVLEEKEGLRESLEELKKQHEELMRAQNEFGKQSEKLQKKSSQLQELIEETMNDETRELYEEIQKLLKDKASSDQLLDKLSNVRNQEKNLERELERMKELFNRLKFETALEQNMKELQELAEQQGELAQKLDEEQAGSEGDNPNEGTDADSQEGEENESETEGEEGSNENESEREDSNNQEEGSEQSNEQNSESKDGEESKQSDEQESNDGLNQENNEQNKDGQEQGEENELVNEQKQINESFEEFEKRLQEIEQLNQELKNPQPLENFDQDQQEINEKLQEIPENMQNGQQQKAGQQMKNAQQQMQEMAEKMGQMQSSMESIVMQENIDHLRDILDNLIKLSFEQETLIKSFQAVQQVDPRFIELSQEQLKLIDNSDVIQDSLLSLASRVVQISNFVTREIGEINNNLDEAMNELRDRNKGKATSHQQYAMTSMNNLALLLDDVLSQMQMTMAEAMGRPQRKSQQEGMPNMSEMQRQLSQQIQDLKKSGKSGRELSQELARLAAEQAEIRRRMQEMQQSLQGQPTPGEEEGEEGGTEGSGQMSLRDAIEKMEENEIDLVNKQLTEELVERQQQILTRMLEAEESIREQKESPEREAETASQNIRKIPPEFEEYLKAKQSELELLKTIPLDLNPFYKKEVNNYFRRLSEQEK